MHHAVFAFQPLPQAGQAADGVVALLQLDPFQPGEIAEDAVLGLRETEDVRLSDRALGRDGGHQIDALGLGDPAEELGGATGVVLVPLDGNVAPVIGQEAGKGAVHLLGVGQVQLQAHAEPLQPAPDGCVRDQDDAAHVVVGEPGQFGDVPGDGGVVLQVVGIDEDDGGVRAAAELGSGEVHGAGQ